MALKHVNLILQMGKEEHLFAVGVVLSTILGQTSYKRNLPTYKVPYTCKAKIFTFNCILCPVYPHMAMVIMVF